MTSPTFENVELDYEQFCNAPWKRRGGKLPRKTFGEVSRLFEGEGEADNQRYQDALWPAKTWSTWTITPSPAMPIWNLLHYRGEERRDFADMVASLKQVIAGLICLARSLNSKGPWRDGKSFDVSSSRGKYLLIHVFATWSQPYKNFRTYRSSMRDFEKKGFEVIGISLDEKQGDLVDFVKKQDVTWPILWTHRRRVPILCSRAWNSIPSDLHSFGSRG